MSPRITLTVPLGHYMELRQRLVSLLEDCNRMREALEAAEAYNRSLEVRLSEVEDEVEQARRFT